MGNTEEPTPQSESHVSFSLWFFKEGFGDAMQVVQLAGALEQVMQIARRATSQSLEAANIEPASSSDAHRVCILNFTKNPQEL